MANHYIRAGATGSANGNNWTDAWTNLPSSLVRGDTYYVADGSYSAHTFNDAALGTSTITVKKATIADHGGMETGWSDTYGDGQATFNAQFYFGTSYYVIDGNGTHTTPSNTESDYGFRIYNASGTVMGVVQILTGASNITLKYIHIENDYSAKDNNNNRTSIYAPGTATYIKVQNCWLDKSGTDGVHYSGGEYWLIERCYCKYLGQLHNHAIEPPIDGYDRHGQTLQGFYGANHIIIRHNYFQDCEGQGLLTIQSAGKQAHQIRFYGNVVFNLYSHYGASAVNAGFNSSGGIMEDHGSNVSDGIYCYNNTIVNVGGAWELAADDARSFCSFIINSNDTNVYGYNNLFYNCDDLTGHVSGFDVWDYHASGGGDTAGGANEQTGISSSIFQNYTGDNFRLTGHTNAGYTLSGLAWWTTTDSFFGTIDSAVDMYGITRSNWDRGAFEYYTAALTTHCIRAGAAGSGSGDDWTNAYTTLPATLTRGHTYYIADGVYGSYTFDDATSGTSLITIKKATDADHGGIETGWLASYGDGNAQFTSLEFTTSYWLLDGQTRGTDWVTSYGIRVEQTPGYLHRCIVVTGVINNITIQYVEMQGAGLTAGNEGNGLRAIGGTAGGATCSYITMQYCYLWNIYPDPVVIHGDHCLIQYCYFGRNNSTGSYHGNLIQDQDSNNFVIRWNKFIDTYGTAVYTMTYPDYEEVNAYIYFYGNVIYYVTSRTGASAGFWLTEQKTVNYVYVLNNTWIGVSSDIVHYEPFYTDYGHERYAYNNLFYYTYDYYGAHENFTMDYSWHYLTGITDWTQESYSQVGEDAANIFVDYAGYDFHLLKNTNSGIDTNSLVPGNAVDMDGVTRTSWSRGAYEFTGGANVAVLSASTVNRAHK